MKNMVFNNIKKYNLIQSGDRIVAGVSGGHDSMAMLYILNEYKKYIDFQIIVAHVNHGVRGDYALRDENFVREQSERLGLEFKSIQVDMVQYGVENGISDEEAGRILRYGFFRELLGNKKGKIAVAHNEDDQAETLIMRIMRGTGIDGLVGMDYIQDDIIRPILNINRNIIEDFVEDNDIDIVLDHTNKENIYTRNKIRLDLIPYIEENFNPNFKESLWRLSRLTNTDVDFLDGYTKDIYDKIIRVDNKDKIIIKLNDLLELHNSIFNRIIRKAIESLIGNLQGFNENHISSIKELVKDGRTGKQIDLPENIKVSIDYKYLVIQKEIESYIKDFDYRLDMGKNTIYDMNIYIDTIKSDKLKDIETGKYLAVFDYDKINGNIRLRNRRDGDRFVPLGMNGRKKVKDFFIDNKISRNDRNRIPFIVDDKNIIWIIGHRISELYKVENNTENVLIIRCEKYNVEE